MAAVVPLHRAALSAAWQLVQVEVSGVNGTLALMTEEAMVYWLDDVAVLAR